MTEEITLAPDEQRKEFNEKFLNPDYYSIVHEIKIKAVEFIPFNDFKEKQIKAEDYKEEKTNYIKENSTDLHDVIENFKSAIEDKGLFVEMYGQSCSDYNPVKSILEDTKKLSPAGLIEFLQKLEGITPPKINKIPKQAGLVPACI